MEIRTMEKDGKKRVDVKLTGYESRAADDALEVVQTAKDGEKVPEATVHLIDALRVFEDADEVNGKPVTDDLREAIYQIVAEAESKYRTTQRDWFAEQYAPEIAERDGHYWQFPYTSVSYALIAYELNRFVGVSSEQAIETIRPLMTGAVKPEKRWQQFIDAHDAIEDHFIKVLETIESGTFEDDEGEKPPIHVERLDEGITIDISPIIAALGSEGFESIDIFGNWDPPIGSIENDATREEGEYYENHVMPDDWYTGSWHLVKGPTQTEDGDEVIAYALVDNHDTMFYFDPTEYFGFVYLTMYALVTRMNCRKSVRNIVYPAKRPRARNLKTQTALMSTDEASRRLFGRDEDEIPAAEYNTDNPITLYMGNTKNKNVARLKVVNKLDIDTAYELYRLSPDDQFWYEALWSIAYNDGKEPVWDIRGTEVMKFNGYNNVYAESMFSTFEHTYKVFDKLMRSVQVAIETDPKKTGVANVTESIGLQGVVNGRFELLRFDDGTYDYIIHLSHDYGESPIDALPLAKYATNTGEIIRAKRDDLNFPGMKLTMEHRIMWRYVMRRARQKKTNKKILIDTLLKNVGLESASKRKRDQMVSALRKMLDYRKKQDKLTYTFERTGGEVRSVEVHIKNETKELPNQSRKTATDTRKKD